jgi:hypothetical protein
MRKLIILLAGISFLIGFRAAAEETSAENVIKVTDVNYDYSLYFDEWLHTNNILGTMSFTLEVNNIDCISVNRSQGHAYTIDDPDFTDYIEAPVTSTGTITMDFKQVSWGTWIRLGAFSNDLKKLVFTDYYCSNDYINSSDLQAIMGGVDNVATDSNLSMKLNGKSVTIQGLTSGDMDVKVYNLLGGTMLSTSTSIAEPSVTIPLDNLSNGIYIISISNGNNTLAGKIQIK